MSESLFLSLSLSLARPLSSLEALNSLTLRLLITRRGIDYHHLDVNENSYSLDFPFKLSTTVSPHQVVLVSMLCSYSGRAPLTSCMHQWVADVNEEMD